MMMHSGWWSRYRGELSLAVGMSNSVNCLYCCIFYDFRVQGCTITAPLFKLIIIYIQLQVCIINLICSGGKKKSFCWHSSVWVRSLVWSGDFVDIQGAGHSCS